MKHCLLVCWTSFFLGLPLPLHIVLGKVVLVGPLVCPLLVVSDFFALVFLIMALCSSFYFQWADCKVAEDPVILPEWFLVTLHIFASDCRCLHFCLNQVQKPACSPELLCP